MAELTRLTDAVQTVYIYGDHDGDEELFAYLERWKDDHKTWDLYNGDGDLIIDGDSYESLMGEAQRTTWPDANARIFYDTERSD